MEKNTSRSGSKQKKAIGNSDRNIACKERQFRNQRTQRRNREERQNYSEKENDIPKHFGNEIVLKNNRKYMSERRTTLKSLSIEK